MDINRRGFLAGFLGVSVIAAMPKGAVEVLDVTPAPAPAYDFDILQSVKAPPGWTYNWVRSALLGEPDPANVQRRLNAGWRFVQPSVHPELPTVTAEAAIGGFGLILMEKQTALIEMPKPYGSDYASICENAFPRSDRKSEAGVE